jgi:hypothetical protein
MRESAFYRSLQSTGPSSMVRMMRDKTISVYQANARFCELLDRAHTQGNRRVQHRMAMSEVFSVLRGTSKRSGRWRASHGRGALGATTTRRRRVRTTSTHHSVRRPMPLRRRRNFCSRHFCSRRAESEQCNVVTARYRTRAEGFLSAIGAISRQPNRPKRPGVFGHI